MKVLWTFVWLFLSVTYVLAQTALPADFSDQVVMDDFDFPVGCTFDEMGNFYVWEKAGRVWKMDSTFQKPTTPLVDIHEEVANWRDHGLLGFALDPNYATNGYLYLWYALDPYYLDYYGTVGYQADSSHTFQSSMARLSRITVDHSSQTTVPNSQLVLIGKTPGDGPPLLTHSHGVGSIVFGKDGSLLASIGDGNATLDVDIGGDDLGAFATQAIDRGFLQPHENVGIYRAQLIDALSGKILRIDPETGEGLPSNPYFDDQSPSSPRSRVWAAGLRNPFRMTIDKFTGSHASQDGQPGHLYIGDVGNGGWEELNRCDMGGQNFGWPITEGFSYWWGSYFYDIPDNVLAPNPLNDQNCEKPFLNFRDVFRRPEPFDSTGGYPIFLPCGSNEILADSLLPQVETLPIITWSNALWNKPAKVEQPFYNEEGNIRTRLLTDSLSAVLGQNFEGFSSIPGGFYRRQLFPSEYQGAFFQADFSDWIRVFHFDNQQQLTKVDTFHKRATQILHLEVDAPDGALYYVNLSGQIRRISYGGNIPPTAVVTGDTLYGPSPLTVTFTALAQDQNNDPLTINWDFGDGQTASDIWEVTHTYTTASPDPKGFTVTTTVTDTAGAATIQQTSVFLNNTPPKVKITSVHDGDLYPGDVSSFLPLMAEVEDAEHPLESLSFAWSIFTHHNTHYHPEPVDIHPSAGFIITPLGCSQMETYWYSIQLAVSDPLGSTGIHAVSIYPDCSQPFFVCEQLLGIVQEDGILVSWEPTTLQGLKQVTLLRGSTSEQMLPITSWSASEVSLNKKMEWLDRSPNQGNNVYMLLATNVEGAFRNSNVWQQPFPIPLQVKVYPNPFTKDIQFVSEQSISDHVLWTLWDVSGRIVDKRKFPTILGARWVKDIDLSHLANGSYRYKIQMGQREESGALMKM